MRGTPPDARAPPHGGGRLLYAPSVPPRDGLQRQGTVHAHVASIGAQSPHHAAEAFWQTPTPAAPKRVSLDGLPSQFRAPHPPWRASIRGKGIRFAVATEKPPHRGRSRLLSIHTPARPIFPPRPVQRQPSGGGSD